MLQTGWSQFEGNHLMQYRILGIDNLTPYAKQSDNGEYSLKFLKPKDVFKEMTAGGELSYYYGIKDFLAVGVPFRMGSYRTLQPGGVITFKDRLFLSADLRAKLSLALKREQFVIPYLSTGVGTMYSNDNWDVQFPAELGLNFRIADNFYANISTEYRFSLDESSDETYSFTNHFVHGVGLAFQWGKEAAPKSKPAPEPVEEVEIEPADRDGDGVADEKDDCPDDAGLAKFGGCPDTDGDDIVDSEDECPDMAGIAAFNGCPDTDNDGVSDDKDNCPTEAGPASNNGCPKEEIVVMDKDSDGIADEKDACPNTPGVAAFNGCPDTDGDGVADKDDRCPSVPGSKSLGGCPDKDGDGVADKDDRCPSTAGTVANKGCPEIKQEDVQTLNFATQGIEFETGSATIRTSSYPILDQVANVMAKYPSHSLSISGYTDNVGSDATNLALSKKRAKACFDYLISKGVSSVRMTHAGYGEENPIADNGTKAGRQKNRRVEFRIFLR